MISNKKRPLLKAIVLDSQRFHITFYFKHEIGIEFFISFIFHIYNQKLKAIPATCFDVRMLWVASLSGHSVDPCLIIWSITASYLTFFSDKLLNYSYYHIQTTKSQTVKSIQLPPPLFTLLSGENPHCQRKINIPTGNLMSLTL